VDWWRALLVMAYMTGWRIGSLLALRREDVNLEQGYAVSRAGDNKGKRDQRIPLHVLVVEHLTKIVSFSPLVFAWDRSRRALFDEFAAIQLAAGVRPDGPKRRYGFHDLRRAFATLNAGRLTPDVLQTLMQHKAYQTTQRYINMAQQLNSAVPALFVPTLPKVSAS
jgi:integrase